MANPIGDECQPHYLLLISLHTVRFGYKDPYYYLHFTVFLLTIARMFFNTSIPRNSRRFHSTRNYVFTCAFQHSFQRKLCLGKRVRLSFLHDERSTTVFNISRFVAGKAWPTSFSLLHFFFFFDKWIKDCGLSFFCVILKAIQMTLDVSLNNLWFGDFCECFEWICSNLDDFFRVLVGFNR